MVIEGKVRTIMEQKKQDEEGQVRIVGRIVWCPLKKNNVKLKDCFACEELIDYDVDGESYIHCRVKKKKRRNWDEC